MKKTGKILILGSIIACILAGCGDTCDVPCDWCGSRPTKKYTTSSGVASYVCKDCRSTCFYCGKKATKHATNYFDMEIFMCAECYDEEMG